MPIAAGQAGHWSLGGEQIVFCISCLSWVLFLLLSFSLQILLLLLGVVYLFLFQFQSLTVLTSTYGFIFSRFASQSLQREEGSQWYLVANLG